jgi:hypothetical protein
VDGLVADLEPQLLQPDPYGLSPWDHMALRFVPVDGGDPSRVPLPGLDLRAQAKVADGQIWVWQGGDAALTVVTSATLSVRELQVELDCRPWMPLPQPPAGLDLREFEHSQLDRFSGLRTMTLVDDQGQVSPFIEGVSFDSVELRGVFPDSHIVTLVQSSDHPRIRFGRQWNLYDELGNPITHEFLEIYLKEDIGYGGLPEPSQCVPDAAGVVWI